MLRSNSVRDIEQWARERPTYPVPLCEYTVATLPDPAEFRSCQITVSDNPGGYTIAVSDGADWVTPSGGGGASEWGGITGTLSDQTDLQTALDGKAASSHGHDPSDVTGLETALAGKQDTLTGTSDVPGLDAALADLQPLDADLSAIAALATTAFGRALLELANAGALRTAAELGTIATKDRTVLSLVDAESSTTTSLSLIEDPNGDWSIPVVSGRTYLFRMVGTFQTDNTTTGARLNVRTVSGGAGTINGRFYGAIDNSVVASERKQTLSSLPATFITPSVAAINTPHALGFEFAFVCTGSGSIEVRWGSEVAASAAQINPGSTLIVDAL
jgi:hypothetical protein